MKPGIGWPIGIVFILTTTVVGNLIVMRVANTDPSFAIEPDYYARGIAFDSTIAEERQSARLGWVARSEFSLDTASTSQVVVVTLADSAGLPVEHATVNVTALYNARANDLLTASLKEISPGKYQAPLATTFGGQWEIRIRATRAGTSSGTGVPAGASRENFETTTRAEAPAPRVNAQSDARTDARAPTGTNSP